MHPIGYFKRQAKNLLQDLKTRKLDPDSGRFVYAPHFSTSMRSSSTFLFGGAKERKRRP